uniref:Uncharacterized protein n=1 Tax=Romanomermis culicivorax TaxID=13658 RepID=A0A915HW34_ROMCU
MKEKLLVLFHVQFKSPVTRFYDKCTFLVMDGLKIGTKYDLLVGKYHVFKDGFTDERITS